MKNNLSSFFVGFLFALGLALSGMTRPEKVIGFLDILGQWDASLMFVMVGAISLHFFLYRWIRRSDKPLFSLKWHVPERKDLTPSLILGSLLFGVGWGVGGYCPGPAIASLGSLQLRPFIFVVSMLLGMIAYRIFDAKIKIKK